MKLLIPFLLFLTIIGCSSPSYKKGDKISILTDLDGNSLDLNNYKGNVLILNIWATWCKPCIAEFKSLEKVKEKFSNRNIEIVAVSNED